MKHKLLFKRFVEKIVNLVLKSGKDALALYYVSDEVILAALQADGRLAEIQDPLAYVNFLRECIQPLTFSVRELKGKKILIPSSQNDLQRYCFLFNPVCLPSIFIWPKKSAWSQIDTALFIRR